MTKLSSKFKVSSSFRHQSGLAGSSECSTRSGSSSARPRVMIVLTAGDIKISVL